MESTLLAGGKSKKDRYLGNPARGQADPGSAAVYTMDWPGPVICMYVCVGTVSHAFKPTDALVVVYLCQRIVSVESSRDLKMIFEYKAGTYVSGTRYFYSL